jgi:hypothetical protein
MDRSVGADGGLALDSHTRKGALVAACPDMRLGALTVRLCPLRSRFDVP